MNRSLIACGSALFAVLVVAPDPVHAAPEWLGASLQTQGRAFTTCTGPAVNVSAAYRGEPDGSSPAVGDVYSIRFSLENLGNCVGSGGETAFGFDPGFALPKRHVPIHDFQYGDQTHRVQCLLRDPAGSQSELAGDKCALKVGKMFGRWFIETAGGYERYRWAVPRGHTLEVIVPVIALDPVSREEGGFKAHVVLQMSRLAGFDFVDLAPPLQTASSPLLVEEPMVEDLTPTGAKLSARLFTRFLAGEAYIQIEPAPMFDSIRMFQASDRINDDRYQGQWRDLTPDTEYKWRAGILVGKERVLGSHQTFRTPPATAPRRVRP